MTVSSMRCSESVRSRRIAASARALLTQVLLALALVMTCLANPAHAGSIGATRAALQFDDDGATLSADFNIDLGSRLEDALLHGITLGFKLELMIERPREYWVAEHIATRVWRYRLSYSGLTRQYRVAFGGLQRDFASLADALAAIGRMSALPVVDAGVLQPATLHTVALRLSLDRSQLPKPFQLDALTNAEWQVDAATRQWSVTTP